MIPGVQAAITNNFPYDQTVNSSPETSFPVGVTTITYTAEDQAGNTATCFFTVTILDDQAPEVTCPADQIQPINCGQGVVQNYVPLVPTPLDNCTDYTITQSPVAGTDLSTIPGLTPADGETFQVRIIVQDDNASFLSDTCFFTVTLDETALPVPTIAGPNLPAAFSECNDITIAAPTADDCGTTVFGVPSTGTLVNVSPPVYQFGIGAYNVIWTYVGANGSVQQTQFVEVLEDLTPPNALCQAVNVNLSNSAPGQVLVTATQFNNGSTDNCSIVAYAFSINGGSYSENKALGCDEVGVHNVSLEVTDFNNNKGYCNTTLTINDVTIPTINGGCPGNQAITTSMGGGYDCIGETSFTVPTVSDNCDIDSYELTITQPSGSSNTEAVTGGNTLTRTFEKGVSTLVFEVTDEHNNSTSCSFTVTTTDDQDPQITCADDGTRTTSADGTGDCLYTINGSEFDPVVAIDNCPDITVSNSENGASTLDGVQFTTGTSTVIWTITDAMGRTATCEVDITVVDNENPEIDFCQSNIVQAATTGTCNALVSWSPTYGFDVDDNCGIDNIVQNIDDPTVIPVYPYQPFGPDFPPFLLNQALFPIGVTTISYTVSDINGNSSVCSFTVEVIDDQAPTVTCPPDQILETICADGSVPDYRGIITNITDNCLDSIVVTQTPAPGTLLSDVPGLTPADGETFDVTISVMDPLPNNLSDECTFTVTLNDVNLPIPDQASLEKDSTDCEELIISPPTATDCGVVIDGVPDKGEQISFNPPLYRFTTGLYTVIWTYVGVNGSVQQTQQIIVEEDVVPPTMVCDDLTINLDANGDATITPGQVDGGSTDNCAIDQLSLDDTDFDCDDVGTNTVVLTATDIHGNSNTCSATITVQDVTAPTFNISNSTVTVNCQSVPSPGNVEADDACGVDDLTFNESITKGLDPDDCDFYTYTITRTWTATDVNNNVSTVQQVINVEDITAPTWTTAMPDTIISVTNQFDCMGGVILEVDALKVIDNCADFSNLSITYTGSNGSSGTTSASGQYPKGTTTLIFTATDPCGNATTKTVTIIINDETPPTAVCVNSITLPLNPQGNLVIPPFIVDNGSYDNCEFPFSTNVALDVFPDTFDCSDAGDTLTLTLTVTDLAGNTASCPATLIVVDNTVPTLISCVPDVTIDCADDTSYLALGGLPIVSDACGTDFDYTDSFVDVGGAICYNIEREWAIIDGSGNTLNCTQVISVTDNTAPAFTSALPDDITIGCGAVVPTAPVLEASDNCGTAVTVTFNEQSTQTSNNTCTDYAYEIFRSWVATDACGNTVDHQQTITVVDTQAPVIFGVPDSVTYFTNDYNADSCAVPVELVVQWIDCQPDSAITITNDSPVGAGDESASGFYLADNLYVITFTATDKCGNSSQKEVKVRVIDNSIPNAVCFAQINATLNSDGLFVLTTSQVDDESKDNCTPAFDLDFTLSQDSFDCKDLGDNVVTLTVTDLSGNSNTCSTTVNIDADPALTINTTVNITSETFSGALDGAIDIDVSGGSGSFTYLWNTGATTQDLSNLAGGQYTLMITDENTGCMKTLDLFVPIAGQPIDTIAGRIETPIGLPVANVIVTMSGTINAVDTTGLDGRYQFTAPSGSVVTITPMKDTLPSNGVTSLDFAVIQQHILAPPNLTPLTTPYKLIAADENGNSSINGIDIARFQTTILNNLPSFPNAPSWVFVLDTFNFPDPQDPWSTGWPDAITFNVLSGNQLNTDFIGVKMGDVTDDVDVTKIILDDDEAESRNDQTLRLLLEDRWLESGELIEIPVRAENVTQLRAYQFAWAFDPQVLSLTGIVPGELPGISSQHFAGNQLSNGLIPHLWSSGAAIDLPPTAILFTLQFEVLEGNTRLSTVLDLGECHLGQIAYDDTNTGLPIDLFFDAEDLVTPTPPDFRLVGNRPNPFADQTIIEVDLPEALPITVTVTDLTGQPITQVRQDGDSGRNQIIIGRDQLGASGMYFYVLQAGTYRALGKMNFQE